MKYLEFTGPVIHCYREAKGIEIGEVCIKTGIQKPQYKAIEAGTRDVLLNTWKRICDAVGLDFVYLFKNLDVYHQLYESLLHALLFDDIEEQKNLYQRLRKEDIERSIMMPKITLLEFMYCLINREQRDYDEIISYLDNFKEAFSLEEKRLYFDYVGFYYHLAKLYDQALKFHKMAEELPLLTHKDIVHYHLGMLYYKKNEPMMALFYLQEAYQEFEKSWNINRLLYTKGSMGICYSRMGEIALAEEAMLETLTLAKQNHNDYVVCNSYNNLAFNSFKKRDYDSCVCYANAAMKMKSTYTNLYFYLTYAYYKLKEYDKSLYWIAASKQVKLDEIISNLIEYVNRLLDNENVIEYLSDVFKNLIVEDMFELQKFIVHDMADYYHEAGLYKEESECLRTLFKIV